MTVPAISDAAVAHLKALTGPGGWLEDAVDKAPYLSDERSLFRGETPLVLRPDSVAGVAEIVSFCAAEQIAIVPQGGNTGYVGGSVPRGGEILISLGRLNRVRAIDPEDYSMTVEAGCILAEAQAAAQAADRLFPLSLGSEGSCQIGGNLSTNAGGTAVLRYGNARDLVLGLEVVLPDGRIWDGLRRLRKDNRGYDLKQLFLGAEGSLGIVTAACLKLFPRPRRSLTAFAAVANPAAATALLGDFRSGSGDQVSSFEYLDRGCLDLVLTHIAGSADPFEEPYQHYVLIELGSGRADEDLTALAEGLLETALEGETLVNAVIASSEAQARQLWRLRETIPEAQKHAGGSIKHDVSVPISQVACFLDQAAAAARKALPGARVIPFGHLGDGNIHFNLTQPLGAEPQDFIARAPEITPIIHDIAAALGGSFSAEHGIGQLKREELRHYKSTVELDLMAKIKQALDPQGLMNPGKLL